MRDLWRRRRLRQLQKMRRAASYAHRGDRERRAARQRRAVLLAGLCASAVLAARFRAPEVATAAAVRPAPVARLLARTTATAHGEVAAPAFLPDGADEPTLHRTLVRTHRVHRYATRYGIPADLATAIHDAAVAEGIEPELAFRLVRVESEFNERATSRVGAVGLTQLMPSTARYFTGPVSRERLYDRHLNLRVGFRYLRGLIREYDSVRLALLVYNRGPTAVRASLDAGRDPSNGYETLVMKGYRGRGTVD